MSTIEGRYVHSFLGLAGSRTFVSYAFNGCLAIDAFLLYVYLAISASFRATPHALLDLDELGIFLLVRLDGALGDWREEHTRVSPFQPTLDSYVLEALLLLIEVACRLSELLLRGEAVIKFVDTASLTLNLPLDINVALIFP